MPQPTTLTALLRRDGTAYSRAYLREAVLAWGAATWPILFEGGVEPEPDFEAEFESSRVQGRSARDGSLAWSFRGIGPEPMSSRLWETRVLVLGEGDRDLLLVSTSSLGPVDSRVLVARPGFLCGLVDHLLFEDGGYPVCTAPRLVVNDVAFAKFREHLLSQRRTLPILVLGPGPTSGEAPDWDQSRAVDARSLARRLCGLAHVVCLGPLVLSRLEESLGSRLAVDVGQARLFMPGLDDTAPEAMEHPVFSSTAPVAHFSAALDCAAAAQAAVYAWSVAAPRHHDFDALWLAHAWACRA